MSMPQGRPKLKLNKLTIRKRNSNNVNCSKGKWWFIPKNFLSKYICSVPTPASRDDEKSAAVVLHPSQEGNCPDNIEHAVTMMTTRGHQEEREIKMMKTLQLATAPAPAKQVDHGGKRLSFIDLVCKNIHKNAKFYLSKWQRSRTPKGVNNIGGDKGVGRSCLVGRVANYVNLTRKLKSSKDPVMQQGEMVELCKMRILMGVKCRPLHKSGNLHYDQNGILLPEET